VQQYFLFFCGLLDFFQKIRAPCPYYCVVIVNAGLERGRASYGQGTTTIQSRSEEAKKTGIGKESGVTAQICRR
jgi:hypothetical protein